jgi:hypothetical protein
LLFGSIVNSTVHSRYGPTTRSRHGRNAVGSLASANGFAGQSLAFPGEQ